MNISIDCGTGFVKIYRGGDPRKGVTRLHNAFGRVSERLLSDGKNIPICLEEIEGDATPFSAGEFALEYGGGATATLDRNCLRSQNHQRGVLSALAKAGIKNGDALNPIFCIPISEYSQRDNEGKREYVRYLKALWNGKHSFTVLGKRQIQFSMGEPRVTMQGVAAIFHYMQSNPSFDITKEDVFLVDTGKRDANYCYLHRGKNTLDEYTGTFEGLSWIGVIEEVRGWLFKEHSARFSALDIERACQQERVVEIDGKERKCVAIHWGKWISLDEILREAIGRCARKQIDKISPFPLDRAPHLLLCGGPACHYLPFYMRLLDRRFKLVSKNYDIATVLGGWQMLGGE